jgi:hypothetical protein
MGRNLKKVEGMVNKINARQGKDKTLGFLSKYSMPVCIMGMVNKINTRQGKDKTLGFLSK